MTTRKRRLSDLFQQGKSVEISDGHDSITVWLQKLNPSDGEKAYRRANAIRARYLTAKADKQSDDYLAVLDEVIGMEKEDLIQFIILDEVVKEMGPIEARIGSEEKWSKDDYLQGLFDAWTSLHKVYETEDDSDPQLLKEAKRVRKELDKYEAEVNKETEALRKSLHSEFSRRSIEKLQEGMVERLFKLQADLAWTLEFRKSQIWLGVRDIDDHKIHHFESREEVDELADRVITQLVAELTELEVDSVEGKDLPPSLPSSPQSDSPETSETPA